MTQSGSRAALHPETEEQLRQIDMRHRAWARRSGGAQRCGSAWQAELDRSWLLVLLDEVWGGDTTKERLVMGHAERLLALRALNELTRVVLQENVTFNEHGIRECQERGLLTCDRKRYPPFPEITPEGLSMVATVLDLFERRS